MLDDNFQFAPLLIQDSSLRSVLSLFFISLQDIADLSPHLLTPHLASLDLSRNAKVRGNVAVFSEGGAAGHCLDALVEVFLHRTKVVGNYASFANGLGTALPRLALVTLTETKVVGDLSYLPGDNDRSTLDVHTKVELVGAADETTPMMMSGGGHHTGL